MRNSPKLLARIKAALFALAAGSLVALGAHAGGPAYLAREGGVRAGANETPITWAGGVVRYYTDRGNLGPILTQQAADALVAQAFTRWTAVPTAAISAIHAGQLAEDVSGANVSRAGGTLELPDDVQPGSGKPLAIVYDADGQVTDALLGGGASALCATNAVFGGPDAFTGDAHIAHALLVINGACVRNAEDIPVLRQRLVRGLGRVLGLGWSQLNHNVVSGAPPASLEDYAGWPLLHAGEAECGGCPPDPEQPRMDDRAALARLYPVTAASLGRFPAKTVFAASTARVSGTVRSGRGQGMRDVNVVARQVDPVSGVPSRRLAVSSISASHPGQGWFDLAGLEIPTGSASAQYQISVEPIEPRYAHSSDPITVRLARGAQVKLDIILEAATDKLILVAGANPGVPVGAQAPNPIRVRVVDKDGVPVAGASVTFSASPQGALLFSPCNTESCTVVSDINGDVATTATVKQAGVITATASLANGASVATTVLGINSPLAIAAVVPRYWVAAHTALTLPLTARVLQNSTGVSGRTVNYQVVVGAATLAAATATTDVNGDGTTALNIADMHGDVQVSACVAPDNAPCVSFYVLTVAHEAMRVEKLGGDQVAVVGQSLQPLSVRVTDASSPPNPVLAPVTFATSAFHLQPQDERTVVGEVVITHPSQRTPATAQTRTVVLTDGNGVAALAPSFATELGALEVTVIATTGTVATTFSINVMWPAVTNAARSTPSAAPARASRALRPVRRR